MPTPDTTPVLQSPRSVAYADLWYKVRALNNNPLPAKTEIPLRSLSPFMPHIAIVQHTGDGRARYTLFGTALVSLFGRDLTGDYVEGPMTDEARARLIASRAAFHAEHGADATFGRWTIGEARTNTGRLLEFENLTFPCREIADGSVRFMSFVTGLATLDYGEGIVQRYPDRVVKMFNASGPRPAWMAQDPDAECLKSATNAA
ncbi:MAG: PAS domain-containing protein [Alphaproteobacteria bacterium]|nr:PAS domain-containing protein [Alphaproteobacteria bacterium]MBO6627272.1 PAS domain-containing protein [Alphaproteobacteria bacterium]MDF1626549.1 PAS domain-containing protein [Parvibaculaceae bacterium]